MNGLENITKAIIDEAQQKADGILEQAKKEAEQLIDDAKVQAQAQSKQILDGAEKKAASINESAQSYCELDKKNAILKAKNRLINTIFDDTVRLLCTLPDDEYFNCLLKMIGANALSGSGEIVLNAKDSARVPSGFKSMLDSKLQGKGSLVISDETDDSIKGGCILKYGNIEIDLRFDKVIAAQKEQLTDKINAVLFG